MAYYLRLDHKKEAPIYRCMTDTGIRKKQARSKSI